MELKLVISKLKILDIISWIIFIGLVLMQAVIFITPFTRHFFSADAAQFFGIW
jgi:hypothetical protein